MGSKGEDLLLFALSNSNEVFLKNAFRNVILDVSLIDPSTKIGHKIITEIIAIMHISTKTELILNVLIFTDFTRWSSTQLKEVLEWIGSITGEDSISNLMYKCYNPILVICLCCDFLTKIGDVKSEFKQQAISVKLDLLDFGEKIIDAMDDTMDNV